MQKICKHMLKNQRFGSERKHSIKSRKDNAENE